MVMASTHSNRVRCRRYARPILFMDSEIRPRHVSFEHLWRILGDDFKTADFPGQGATDRAAYESGPAFDPYG